MAAKPGRLRADELLLKLNLAPSRSVAQALILAGKVRSGPDSVVQKASQSFPEDALLTVDQPPRFVSRGGEKVDAALTHYFRAGNLTALRELALLWPLLGRHIVFHRRLVDITRSVKAALLLSQMIYWTRHGRDIAASDGWFHKTARQWELETALTAREHGPEMKNLLPLIGRERASARLSGATA